MEKAAKYRYNSRKMSLLTPTSIAVIGASEDPKKVGHAIFKNLLTQGFKGTVYPVNPKSTEILGEKAYPSLNDVPGTIEMAVIVTPAATVAALAEECGKKKVKTLIVISAGFGETGTAEGHGSEEKLLSIAKKYRMQLIGPNCLGMLRPNIGMNASFAEDLPMSGNVALISQSGALAVALMNSAPELHLGFSLVVSMGNKTAMDECDFLEISESDNLTKVIGLYLEGIKNGERFLSVARRVATSKPIVLIKSGVSERGKRAVSSHTGALAGSDAAIDAVCAQTGIHRAHTTEEFLDLLRTLSTQPPLASSQIAVITNAGGPGILATDGAEHEGLTLAPLSAKQKQALKKVLPSAASCENPIDVLGDALADRYSAALTACASDPEIDGVVALLTPQIMTPCTEIARAIVDMKKRSPLMPIVASFMGGSHVEEAIRELQANGIVNFETPEAAVHALAALRNSKIEIQNPKQALKTKNYKPKTKNKSKASLAATRLLKNQRGLLSDPLTKKIFALYNLPLPSQALAQTGAQAVKLAEAIGYPVVAKVSSPQILHKTDVGGIRTNLHMADEVKSAFLEIKKNVKKSMPKAHVRGILIQKQLPPGSEFIVGAIRDPSFGHLVMAGLGGIYTELFADTSFCIAPVTMEEAYEMLQQLKAWKLLLGLRGKKQMDIDALAETIVKISKLVTENPEIAELDLNPVIVREDGIVIADAKVIIAQ